ncbi:TraR/DksA C4-type zinc finger protein [Dermatophilaceae bacterium Soc4.6]
MSGEQSARDGTDQPAELVELLAARRSLQTERDRLETRVRALDADMAELVEASRDSNADDEHDPEGQTIGYERAQLAALTAASRRRLVEVDAALERVGTSAHGRCAQCGGPVGAARLEARPTARTCVTCAQQLERAGIRGRWG